MAESDFGLIGLAVMGQNLALNVESRGYRVSVFNRSTEVMEQFLDGPGAGRQFVGAKTLEAFVSSLKKPRKIHLMVKAGDPVDGVIAQLLPLLDDGDLIIDGGNSLYTETERRYQELAAKGIHFLGAGISGGEEGALKGPSIMPGGASEAWRMIKPVFTRIAAQVDGEPCCRYMGRGGAGHYVKMVHNGIEYGDMQLICEAYQILSHAGLDAPALARVFSDWNQGELESYLIQITANIFTIVDPETGNPLVEMILDKAGQKGTGRWTVISATELGCVTSTINAAVEGRVLSALKSQRVAAQPLLPGPAPQSTTLSAEALIPMVHDALFASKIISYAQGMDMLAQASKTWGWQLNLADIATIWRGGCIIRAQFLNRIREAYEANPNLSNLMLDDYFQAVLNRSQQNWRKVIAHGVTNGIPVPAFSASLGYFDSYRQARLPANLLQAQRDYFGAHTYERVDKPEGTFFHSHWPEVID